MEEKEKEVELAKKLIDDGQADEVIGGEAPEGRLTNIREIGEHYDEHGERINMLSDCFKVLENEDIDFDG